MNLLDNVELPAAEQNNITKFAKAFGDDWVKRGLRSAKARVYINQNLNSVDVNTRSGNCYAAGETIFTRKDGDEITDEEVEIILTINRGQVNRVSKREPCRVAVRWECDSSG